MKEIENEGMKQMDEHIKIKVKRVNSAESKEIAVPRYATQGAAGADLYACLDQDLILKPGERAAIPTGIAIELPTSKLVALVFARSGLASHKGLTLSNGVGVIDSDYRGEIKVLMVNLGQENVIIQNGERIAQLIFINVYQALFIESEELGETLRGEGGFGSTGQK
ncbi:MAG: dUTP diphosphatase [Desulfitobacteriia bacterium]|jgi:dUTP pyrophosphatase